MLHIGKWAWKTLLALLLSLSLYLVLIGLNRVLGFTELPPSYVANAQLWYVPTNWYTPFFAGIASIYAMSPTIRASQKQANIRSAGSVVGGVWGYIVWMLYVFLFPHAVKGEVSYYICLFLITSIGILPLMKMIRVLHIPQAAFITGLTYLAVTISVRNGGMGALLFTVNRILSTVIGVSIAVWVNTMPHFVKKRKDILFVCGLDGVLYDENNRLDPLCLNYLTDFQELDANYTFLSFDPVTYVQDRLDDLTITKPMIVMDGSAIYIPEEGYREIVTMTKETERKIERILEEHDTVPFCYAFHENHLFGYYRQLNNEGARHFYEEHDQLLTPLVKAQVPEDVSVSNITAVIKDEQLSSVLASLQELAEITVHHNPEGGEAGWSHLYITSKEASFEKAFEKCGFTYDKLVVLGGDSRDLPMMKKADYALCLKNAPESVKAGASEVVDSAEPKELLHRMQDLFFNRTKI